MFFLTFPKLPKLRYIPNCKQPGPIPNELEKNPYKYALQSVLNAVLDPSVITVCKNRLLVRM